MKARTQSTSDKGTVTSGKMELETALKYKDKLKEMYPNDEHRILITN